MYRTEKSCWFIYYRARGIKVNKRYWFNLFAGIMSAPINLLLKYMGAGAEIRGLWVGFTAACLINAIANAVADRD